VSSNFPYVLFFHQQFQQALPKTLALLLFISLLPTQLQRIATALQQSNV
jgi:hypothetical protein